MMKQPIKKYKLTDNTIVVGGRTLYQIQATTDFGNVKKDEYGGYIETKYNLSQEGDCWVSNNACVYEQALVEDDAKIYGDAHVYGNVWVTGRSYIYGCAKAFGWAKISGDATICKNATVCGNAIINEKACVEGSASVLGGARICGHATISGHAYIYNGSIKDRAKICGSAIINGDNDFFYIGGLGTFNHSITFFKTKNGISVRAKQFESTIEGFENRVREVYGKDKYAKEYMLAIELAKVKILEKVEIETNEWL